jgi:pectate lyase
VCHEPTGLCASCIEGESCDDGLFCNGEESCVADECVHGGNPCGPEETCDESTDTCTRPVALWEDLLGGRVGFGREALGGAGGGLCVVTSLANSGAGTLRECAAGPGPRWIRFAVSGTIRLESRVDVASNVTIDGRGADITITRHGLVISGVSHVIVHNISIADGIDGDGIQIINGASHIWIDHVSLSDFDDGLIDITRAATDVTVSWCRFEDHNKVMLIGASAESTGDVAIRVTLHHNFFDGTSRRHPRLRFGRVHAFNNYLRRWESYGMASSMYGQLLSEHNIFEADESTDAVITQDLDPHDGAVESRRDWQLNGAEVDENDTELVFEASDTYAYSLEDANDALRDAIEDGAGRRDVPFPE